MAGLGVLLVTVVVIIVVIVIIVVVMRRRHKDLALQQSADGPVFMNAVYSGRWSHLKNDYFVTRLDSVILIMYSPCRRLSHMNWQQLKKVVNQG